MGLNAELSRLVRAADGTAVYLVPGHHVVATIERGGSGSVLGLSQALDGTGISTSFRGTGRLQILGLLPDDVHVVTVARRNGDEIDGPVPDHLYSADVHASAPEELPAVVRFDLDGREQRLRVPGADEILSLRAPLQQGHERSGPTAGLDPRRRFAATLPIYWRLVALPRQGPRE